MADETGSKKSKKKPEIEKKQYPKLIGVDPEEQLAKLPALPDHCCAKRNKSCQIRSGGCGYRFKKGDKSWVCPKCGQDRRCTSPKVFNAKACRMHGGAVGAGHPNPRYRAPMVIREDYNKALSDPELLTLGHEIATMIGYTQQLFDLLEQQNVVLAHQEVQRGLHIIEDGISDTDFLAIRRGVQMIAKAMDPINLQIRAWREVKDNYKIQLAMAAKQQEWLAREDELMPRQHVLEVMIWINRIGMKYIKSVADRNAYGKEVIALLPSSRPD